MAKTQQSKWHGVRLYRIWSSMKSRTSNPKHSQYKYYGARGIRVCQAWRDSYSAFETWATANGYSDDLSIDRIDNNGNYEPDNCRWATSKQQSSNKRPPGSRFYITYNGETKNYREWSRITGLRVGALHFRRKQGWNDEKNRY